MNFNKIFNLVIASISIVFSSHCKASIQLTFLSPDNYIINCDEKKEVCNNIVELSNTINRIASKYLTVESTYRVDDNHMFLSKFNSILD